MTPDSELLTRYATERDEAAFAELVQRHVDHVYTKISGPNVFVTVEGYVPKVIGLHGSLPATYTMKLDPGRSAAGWVINDEGQPVAGVKLGMQTRSGDYKSGAEKIDFQTIKILSDENGAWRCSCIPFDYDEVRFILTHDEYAVTLPVVPVNQVSMTNLVFVIDRGFTVVGQVTDLAGLPVADAEVRELCTTSYRRQTVHTDASGAFVLKGVSGYESSMGSSPERIASGACLIRGFRGTGKASIKLVVQAEGFAPEIKMVALDSPATEVQFGLSEGPCILGKACGPKWQTCSQCGGANRYRPSGLLDVLVAWSNRWHGLLRVAFCSG